MLKLTYFLGYVILSCLSVEVRGGSCGTQNAVRMCYAGTKTGTDIYLESDVLATDRIIQCTCTATLIKPTSDGNQLPLTIFPPSSWSTCDYRLDMAGPGKSGVFNCLGTSNRATPFQLQNNGDTVNIVLAQDIGQTNQVSECSRIFLQSIAGSSFTISCSLPNNQSLPTALTTFISTVTTTDTHTPLIKPSITSTSTITGVYKTSSPSGGPQIDINTQETPVGGIIGGVLGVILVIGCVVLAILVWRCYRAKLQEEDTTYSSLDLQNNVNPADVTYQGLQTNLSSNQLTAITADVCENRSTNQAFSADEQFGSTQSASISQINNIHILKQPASTDATYNNLLPTPTYENQSSPIGQTNTNQDSDKQIPNNQHYENLT